MSTPEQQLKEIIDGQEPERAMLALLQWQFIKLAELDGTVNAIMPVLGLVAKRMGITGKELDRAFDDYATGHGMGIAVP